jgi:putative transposase
MFLSRLTGEDFLKIFSLTIIKTCAFLVRMLRKTFTYRIFPTAEQQRIIAKTFGCCRYVYNWGLAEKIKTYETTKATLSCVDLIKRLTALKQEFPWLKEVYSQALQMSLRNLDNAFTRFFKKQSGFPKFKSRKNYHQSCQFPQGVKVNFDEKTVYFPKIGHIRLKLRKGTHTVDGKIKTVTLRQTPSGKYFTNILVEYNQSVPSKPSIVLETTIGIDMGIKIFATLSTGETIEHPKTLKQSLKKLKRLHRQLSRKHKGGQNRSKARKRLAKLHEHVKNQRKDFLHKVSHRLTSENQADTIAMETLHIAGMIKNHKLAQAIADSAWGLFDQFVAYKCDWRGKNHVHIGRFAASSRICSLCGWYNAELTLKDRTWICNECGNVRDRDLNAAENIKVWGVYPQNLIGLT